MQKHMRQQFSILQKFSQLIQKATSIFTAEGRIQSSIEVLHAIFDFTSAIKIILDLQIYITTEHSLKKCQK